MAIKVNPANFNQLFKNYSSTVFPCISVFNTAFRNVQYKNPFRKQIHKNVKLPKVIQYDDKGRIVEMQLRIYTPSRIKFNLTLDYRGNPTYQYKDHRRSNVDNRLYTFKYDDVNCTCICTILLKNRKNLSTSILSNYTFMMNNGILSVKGGISGRVLTTYASSTETVFFQKEAGRHRSNFISVRRLAPSGYFDRLSINGTIDCRWH